MPVATRPSALNLRGAYILPFLLALASCAGCGVSPSPEPTPEPRPTPSPGPAGDPISSYRRAGLIVESGPLPFIGMVRYFAGVVPDSTLTLIVLSVANRSLTFVGEGNQYRATYRVTTEVRRGSALPRQVEARESVRLPSYRETSRSDESIVFQQFLSLVPGENQLTLIVRDGGSPRMGSTNFRVTVPRLPPGKLSSPVLVYEATPRTTWDSLPSLIANPRATVVFGRDSVVSLYVEGYGITARTPVVVSALTMRQETSVWSDTVQLPMRENISTAVVNVPVSNIGAGELSLAVSVVGSSDTVRTPLFVSFGEEWAITSFSEMLSYLRYFATSEEVSALRNAAPEGRAAAWSAFWKATDPVPTTPENEALREYFARVRIASERFSEEGGPGWLTDRGRVLLTLGDPDQILERQELNVQQRGRSQVWVYERHQIRLVFVDQTGFSRWRLTMSSEVDLQTAARDRRR